MSDNIPQNNNGTGWGKWKRELFRIAFVFLLLLSVPLYGTYYKRLFSVSLFDIRFQDLFQLTYHVPGAGHFAVFGVKSFTGWLLALVLAVIIGIIWGRLDKARKNYDTLYYWGRVLLRYRLALGVIVYGIILLIPVQIPPPALSDLHTAYGDFLPWKIYYHSTGVAVAGYRQTIGAFEILGAVLLLWRRTVAIGTIIIAFILINVVLANFAYNIGDHLYSTYLLLISLVLLAHDLPRLYALLVKETRTYADRFQPVFSKRTKRLRVLAKAGFSVFSVAFLVLSYKSYSHNWPYPDTVGLKEAEGYYDVSSFKINDRLIPYSLTDSVRWKDVVFEKWNVLSIRNNYPRKIDYLIPGILYEPDFPWRYEVAGNAGRSFYAYDETGDVLALKNLSNSADTISLTIQRPDPETILLWGVTAGGDSIHAALTKVDKEYLLTKGRRKPVSVY
ncbi:MAG: DoxX family protein [Chitinophagaceae bacterium]|nr:DoxX family protein [Chitinophagaceae bacterium]MCW5928659.1 DoxX family protein [Chitinophagaceae bacterium]